MATKRESEDRKKKLLEIQDGERSPFAILKIVILPYFSEISSDFDEILNVMQSTLGQQLKYFNQT